MATDSAPRLGPLPVAEWDGRLAPILEGLDPALNVHRVLAHHPDLLAAWWPLRGHVALGGSLRPRHREIVILRVAHRAGSAYEWHHHVVRASREGVVPPEIEAIRRMPTEGWAADEATLLEATDELFDARSIAGPTWDDLLRTFSVEQVLDLVFTVGTYLTLSMLISAAGIRVEA